MARDRNYGNWAILPSLTLIAVAATWLRLHRIADKSFWTDEGVSAAMAKLDWYNFARILWRREGNMSLYYLLLRAWTLIGDSDAMIRGLSVLWSVAMVPVLFLVGRRLKGWPTGLIAAALWSVNAYAVRYAQEARSYSLAAFLVTLAAYFFCRAVESERPSDWNWYIATSALSIYAHFFSALVIVAHAIVLWFTLPQQKPQTLRAAKRIALWTIPVWLFIVTTGVGPIAWIHRPGLHELAASCVQWAGNRGIVLALIYLGATAVAVIVATMLRPKWKAWLPIAWFAIPVVITLIASMAKPVFLPRYLIVSLPGLILMVALGISSLQRAWLILPVMAAICWLGVQGTNSYYQHDFDLTREDCRGATEFILKNAKPGDVVAFHKEQNRFAYSYYAGRLGGTRPAIIYPGGEQPTWRDFMGKVTPQEQQSLSQHQRVWLVISQTAGGSDEDEPSQLLKASLTELHTLAIQQDFPYLRVYLYEAK